MAENVGFLRARKRSFGGAKGKGASQLLPFAQPRLTHVRKGALSGSVLCQEGGVSFGVSSSFGRGASQLPGVRRGNGGESALEVCVLLSAFFFWGGGGASQLWSCVCCCLLLRGMEASQLPGGRRGNVSQLWSCVCCRLPFFWGGGGASQLPGCEGGMM